MRYLIAFVASLAISHATIADSGDVNLSAELSKADIAGEVFK